MAAMLHVDDIRLVHDVLHRQLVILLPCNSAACTFVTGSASGSGNLQQMSLPPLSVPDLNNFCGS